MQPIKTDFFLGSYHYTQLERQDDVALYQQQHVENPKVVRYEVIRIRRQPEKVWPDGSVTPEREAYPGSAAWGRDGFTTYSMSEAKALMQELARAVPLASDGENDAHSLS